MTREEAIKIIDNMMEIHPDVLSVRYLKVLRVLSEALFSSDINEQLIKVYAEGLCQSLEEDE